MPQISATTVRGGHTPIMACDDLSVLTPYIIPPTLAGKKIVNIGDGFILRAIERLCGVFPVESVFSPRVELGLSEIAILEASSKVVLAGANQLNDNFSVWPKLTAEKLKKSALVLVPFGVGIHGEKGKTDGLSNNTKAILEVVHERIEYSSWRCPLTVRFLEEQLPHLKGRFLMTGCPVMMDSPLLDGVSFTDNYGSIAVTTTERHDFWERESKTLEFVAKQFPRSKRFLVLHQNYSQPGCLEPAVHFFKSQLKNNAHSSERLRYFARKLGFQIVIPKNADEAISFYQNIDVHFGSRLHAHLLFLSRNKRSYLTKVDERSTGFAMHFGFPLCNPERLESYLEFDFEPVRAKAQSTFVTMSEFIRGLSNV